MRRATGIIAISTVAILVLLNIIGGTVSAVTVETLPLSGDPRELKISGHRVCYLDYVSLPDLMHVHSYNLITGVDTDITPVDEDRVDPDIDGDVVVWYESGGLGVYMYDFNAPIVGGTAIPGAGAYAFDPALSGPILAWREMDFVNTVSNIWYRQGAASTQVTNLATNLFALSPDVAGNYIVWYWQDISGAPSDTKIYYYDVANPVAGGTIFASGPSSQADPQIYGSNVVYMDDIDGTDWELFLIAIPGGAPQRITDNMTDDVAPDISGNYIVWARDGQIFMYDILAGQETQLSDSGVGGTNVTPKIDGNHVVWLNQSVAGSFGYLATIQDEGTTTPTTPELPYTGKV